MTATVESALETARGIIQRRFVNYEIAPTSGGEIRIDEKEYVLFPKDCFQQLENLLGENGARIVLYDLGKMMGRAEAKSFLSLESVPKEALVRLLLRPFFYMARGLGTVDILKLEWDPEDPSSLVVLYEDLRPVVPYLVAGFSAGWKSEAVGVELEARPVKMEGSEALRVVVAARPRLVDLLHDPAMAAPRESFDPIEVRLP